MDSSGSYNYKYTTCIYTSAYKATSIYIIVHACKHVIINTYEQKQRNN